MRSWSGASGRWGTIRRYLFERAGDPVYPGPTTQHLVGQGPRALPGVRGKFGSGRRGRRPLRKRILWCVGEELSCPPSCQPTDGHCRTRQSRHFLEIGLLYLPLAALRRFPLTQGRLWGRELRISTAIVRTGNDMVFCMRCSASPGGGLWSARPTEAYQRVQ